MRYIFLCAFVSRLRPNMLFKLENASVHMYFFANQRGLGSLLIYIFPLSESPCSDTFRSVILFIYILLHFSKQSYPLHWQWKEGSASHVDTKKHMLANRATIAPRPLSSTLYSLRSKQLLRNLPADIRPSLSSLTKVCFLPCATIQHV